MCCPARSTAITRSVAGRSLRSVWAATMSPIPAPRIKAIRLMASSSEGDDLVGPLRPVCQHLHAAAWRPVDQLFGRYPARIDTGAAHASLAAGSDDHAEHVASVVITLRHLLTGLGAGDRVADQKNLHLR